MPPHEGEDTVRNKSGGLTRRNLDFKHLVDVTASPDQNNSDLLLSSSLI